MFRNVSRPLRGILVISPPRHCIPNTRHISTTSVRHVQAVLSRLREDLKNAMKAKDSFTSTTIRSILAEIYAAQKDSPEKVFHDSDFVSIIRKAEQRRLDAAMQFESASRLDLADKERGEAQMLSNYLPALLDPVEIKIILQDILNDLPEDTKRDPKSKGTIIKELYKRADRSRIKGDIVKQQLDEILRLSK